ncbi:DUF983 domain-containing protein [Pelagerythrobacter rhizovicinus]|uniref:DUF983 domain-containing protein n=1 Tax=Pelagerythrobacter rhizovicinus TaxID=2268576 RepID=A0A4Q2KMV5_9SPHN|nr:DUF983 domain-containing protein [Pelagerythrobacter rhizovicinus]RXZ66685.1 DUF983 domain-containing protein [Pelagerythrobacter rhizovicinus]
MEKGQPGIAEAALFALCPRCGGKTLFASGIRFAGRCRTCDLDYDSFNVGDGPAAFLTLLIGAAVTALAISVELAFRPPLWLHALLWVPVTALAVIFGLRIAKGALLASEFRNRAKEAGGREQ